MDYLSLGYFGLFLICFLAATVLPFSSEIVFSAFLILDYDPVLCLLVATIGNSLGGITNYGIGCLGKTKWLLKFGVTMEQIEKKEITIKKYSFWLALFSWIPLIGDPLLIGLGYFKVPLVKVIPLMSIGKFLRYFVLLSFFNE